MYTSKKSNRVNLLKSLQNKLYVTDVFLLLLIYLIKIKRLLYISNSNTNFLTFKMFIIFDKYLFSIEMRRFPCIALH